MNRLCWLLVVAMALWTATAAAQSGNVKLQPNGDYYNIGSKAKVDANGNALTVEQFPLSGLNYEEVFADTISNANNGNQIDSTGVFSSSAYNSLTLYVYPITHGHVDSTIYVELQVRGHFFGASDSNTTYSSARWASGGWFPAAMDTIGHNATQGVLAAENGLSNRSFVMAIRPDVAIRNNSITAMPKGFTFVIPYWRHNFTSLRFRVMNVKTSVTLGHLRTRLAVIAAGGPL